MSPTIAPEVLVVVVRMNIHFHERNPPALPPIIPPLATDRRPAERQAMILDAFERCIVRSGFHRTTMQDVAKEAGMSAGNLYRYFESKEQLVSGLCERDRERFSADFQHVHEQADVMSSFVELGRKHFVEEPRSRCIQFMEIWAEATRNPAVAAVCLATDLEITERIVALIEVAKRAGQVAPHVDSAAAFSVLSAIGDGMHMRRSLDPDFDPAEGFRLMLAVMDGIFSGRIDLDRPDPHASTGDASDAAAAVTKPHPDRGAA